MKLLKFFAFIALTFILLFSTSVSCPDSTLRDDSVEIIIEPETGSIATEFHFSAKTGSDWPWDPDYWLIEDENQNVIDLGDDAYKTELSKRFESPGQYKVHFFIGRAGNSCYGEKLFTIEDNGCDNYVIDDTTWLIPEIDLSPHRSYSGTQNDSVSYGFI